ncbi:alpha/beta fold hydrolase [Granulosicoccus sp. 3-233]|uniref:alpha/beta fold hydrolase n=1 Tax=Granulosicoccus sp. 3-233 TaxID=3417969 RepID=UPI003D3474AE
MTAPYRLETAGLTVNLRQEGAGPPLLFLGGSNFDLSINAPVFDSQLPRHFSVAAADPRGLGGTDAPNGNWSMKDYAQDALNMLDALGWNQVDVLGESFGAMVAMHLAALAPERVQRLALAAGSPGGEGGSSYPVQNLLDIDDLHLRARSTLEILDTRFQALQTASPDEAERLIRKRMAVEKRFRESHRNAQGYPRLLAARADHDAWDLLPLISAPTLVFCGQHDGQAPPRRGENIASAMPDATLHMIDGGHAHCFATSEPVDIILDHWVG